MSSGSSVFRVGSNIAGILNCFTYTPSVAGITLSGACVTLNDTNLLLFALYTDTSCTWKIRNIVGGGILILNEVFILFSDTMDSGNSVSVLYSCRELNLSS